MKKSTITILIIVAALGIIGSFYFTNSKSVPGADIVLYPIQCDQENPGSFDTCANPSALERKAYKVNKEDREIVEWSPDIVDSAFETYKEDFWDCTILDTKNWSCSSVLYTFGFKNGIFSHDPPFYGKKVIFVSKSQWDSVNTGKF